MEDCRGLVAVYAVDTHVAVLVQLGDVVGDFVLCLAGVVAVVGRVGDAEVAVRVR